jgi:hypothetical protein
LSEKSSKHPLDGPNAKVDRARHHLRCLNAETAEWVKEHPLGSTGHFDPETGWHVERFNPPPEVPLSLAVIVGDYLHDLRSALDHLAWQIVRRHGGRKPGGHTAFPIHTSRDDFFCQVELPSKRNRSNKLWGLTPGTDAWTFIEGLQPYHRGDPRNDPLALIQLLNNIDKHRELPLTFLQVTPKPRQIVFTWDPDVIGEPIEQHFHLTTGQRVEAGAKIASFRFPRPGPLDSGVVMKGQLELAVDFQYGKSGAAGQGLYNLGLHVEHVLNSARPLFG